MCGTPHPLNRFGREVSQAWVLRDQERNSATKDRPGVHQHSYVADVLRLVDQRLEYRRICRHVRLRTVRERWLRYGLAHVRKPCVHNHGCSLVSQADVTGRSVASELGATTIGVRTGYNDKPRCGQTSSHRWGAPWLNSPRLSRGSAVPSSGILSEGDKRDSKGDMPEPPRSSPPLQFSGMEGGDRVQRRLCSGASVSDSAEEDP